MPVGNHDPAVMSLRSPAGMRGGEGPGRKRPICQLYERICIGARVAGRYPFTPVSWGVTTIMFQFTPQSSVAGGAIACMSRYFI